MNLVKSGAIQHESTVQNTQILFGCKFCMVVLFSRELLLGQADFTNSWNPTHPQICNDTRGFDSGGALACGSLILVTCIIITVQ